MQNCMLTSTPAKLTLQLILYNLEERETSTVLYYITLHVSLHIQSHWPQAKLYPFNEFRNDSIKLK